MYSEIYYLIRSKADGQYLAAHPRQSANQRPNQDRDRAGFLLLFREHFEALSYLNTHGRDVAGRFGVESVPGSQLESLLKRWDFCGVGIVQDPLLPKVEFMERR